ncbi:MAG TPA: hypothetical protein VHM70_22020 [Polyangiaceae bacterium]|jgi:hypothetical protein|nr:hypothetical protein [Polyangiaceae bacterium]
MQAIVLVAIGIVAFLVSAKLHGRELRLEREAAGYHQVVFGGQNPPWVEALWHAERVRFWSWTAGLALVLALICWWQKPSASWWITTLALGAPTLAFAVCTVLSAVRYR